MDRLDFPVPATEDGWAKLELGLAELSLLRMSIVGFATHHETWRSDLNEVEALPGTEGEYYLYEFSVAWTATHLLNCVSNFLNDSTTLGRGPVAPTGRAHHEAFSLIDIVHPTGGMPGLAPFPCHKWQDDCDISYSNFPLVTKERPVTFSAWYWLAYGRACLSATQLKATASQYAESDQGHSLAEFWKVVRDKLMAVHS